MKKKSIGIRILLGIAGVAIGVIIQVVGAIVDKIIGFPLFLIIGFVVMGYLIYRWSIK